MQKVTKQQTDFFHDVCEVVKLVPKGRVSSYGAIANYLGMPRSSRMVGWAMNNAHGDPTVPAHRIVNRNGILTGKHNFDTPSRMEELLGEESVEVKDDSVVRFKELFWDPSIELDFEKSENNSLP